MSTLRNTNHYRLEHYTNSIFRNIFHFFSFIQVSGYTLEAGVRELERKIGSLCRAVAVQIAEDNKIMDETTKNSAVSF